MGKIMGFGHSRIRPRSLACVAGVLAAAVVCGPVAAQQRQQSQIKAVTISSLTEQGFEIKALGRGDALVVQKGKDVFWCILHLSNTSPLSYQSECYSIR
ncbi:MAG TPA: hypothetical protein VIJ17_05065 [Pseudolabrys sp.]